MRHKTVISDILINKPNYDGKEESKKAKLQKFKKKKAFQTRQCRMEPLRKVREGESWK